MALQGTAENRGVFWTDGAPQVPQIYPTTSAGSDSPNLLAALGLFGIFLVTWGHSTGIAIVA